MTPSHGLDDGRAAQLWLHLPFTFIILYAARLAIPTELYEAARIDGANGWQTFRRVTCRCSCRRSWSRCCFATSSPSACSPRSGC